MRVLMITGDKNFKQGHERYELQRSVVETLEVVYWGRGSMWPNIPAGKFDIVTTQDPFWRGLFGMWVAKRQGVKLNVQVHTDLAVYSGIKHILMQIVLRHADTIRVVSQKIKQQVERIGVRATITVLPVFVDISKFQNVVPLPHPDKNILWVGRFENEKDPLLAVEIIAKIPEARLIMLGKGSMEHSLRDKAAGLPVEFPGWDDPVKYLPTADVVLCTSKHESWGASIVEALAAGVPVVAPDVGIAKEAGATIWPPSELHKGVIEILQSGGRAQLQIPLLDKDTWANTWAKSL